MTTLRADYQEIVQKIAEKTALSRDWHTSTDSQRVLRLKDALAEYFLGSPPWYIIEGDDCPIVMIYGYGIAHHNPVLLFRSLPPESARIIVWNDCEKTAHMWSSLMGDPVDGIH